LHKYDKNIDYLTSYKTDHETKLSADIAFISENEILSVIWREMKRAW
jgi:predicted rRNA methylase YqxC with S4 and FtsJ domains